MRTKYWQQVEDIFHTALAMPLPEQIPFARVACGGQQELEREVVSLIEAAVVRLDAPDLPVISWISGGRADPKRASTPGVRIGPYTVIREIGQGGMSTVFLAARSDDELTRRVAIKVLSCFWNRGLVERFHTERQILANLEHVNIARLYEGGSQPDGAPYFVMEYINGKPIDEYCLDEGLTLDRRLELFQAVCRAVSYAHRNEVIHRDIKPGNILVTADGVPKLLDFGIAKLQPTADTEGATTIGLEPMTPSYASPEQLQGRVTTALTDVYSLGMLLYKLLTGELPYRGASLGERIAEMARGCEVQNPSQRVLGAGSKYKAAQKLRRRIAGDLDAITLKALQQDPARRYASVEHLAQDLYRHRARRRSSQDRTCPTALGGVASW